MVVIIAMIVIVTAVVAVIVILTAVVAVTRLCSRSFFGKRFAATLRFM